MGSLMGSQINPVTPSPMVGSGTQNQFFQALFGTGLGTNADGYGYLAGAPGYGGPTSPDVANTILPQVSSNWAPWNAGTGYLADWLSKSGGKQSDAVTSAQANLSQYGGIGGAPTQMMNGMAQYGGTGGPGNQAMSSLLQFGAPSAAGKAVKDMSQYGVSGSWGNQLLARANGQAGTPAANYLAPFLAPQAYKSKWGGK